MTKTKKVANKFDLSPRTKDSMIESTLKHRKITLKTENENLNKINEEPKQQDFDLNIININIKNIKNRVFIPSESKHILNIYEFDEAIKYEKRSLCKIYFIFLISKQVIMHVFFYKSPIEPLPLRISLLISIFQFDFGLNAIFYTDDKIGEKHKSGKSLITFALTDNLIVIILSTLIGYAFLIFFSNLNNIVNEIRQIFRKEEEKIKKDEKYTVDLVRKKEIILSIKKLLRNFKIKVAIFYIVEIIIMIFYWYYCTMFCFVYNKTQFSWLFDTFLTVIVRILFDLVINLAFALLYRLSVISRVSFLYKAIICLYCFS